MYFLFGYNDAEYPHRWAGKWPFIKDVLWKLGARFSATVPDPVEVTLKPLANASDHGPEIPEYLAGSIPLFSDKLIEALRRGGVDNIDTYNAVIVDPDNGARITTHKAVNVIGAISAADLEQSEAVTHGGGGMIDTDFNRLVIDESKTKGALMFRLAEATRAILVHEQVRDHLLKEGFIKLAFYNLDEVAL
jgi:hypothetical protein